MSEDVKNEVKKTDVKNIVKANGASGLRKKITAPVVIHNTSVATSEGKKFFLLSLSLALVWSEYCEPKLIHLMM